MEDMDNVGVIRLESTDSTNSYMAAHAAGLSHGTMVTVREQSAGRGQRGNSWESEPGMNVTMSMLLLPDGLQAVRQFLISEAVAVGVADTLRHYLGDNAGVSVKWPNDIYVGDRKICGILIENVLTGRGITRSIAGVGLNVNQRRFCSDAPNPVSMFQLTGCEADVDEVAVRLRENILRRYDEGIVAGMADELHTLYKRGLWRRDGMNRYADAATGRVFEAEIKDVALTGHITLREPDGTETTYAFKEVAAVME